MPEIDAALAEAINAYLLVKTEIVPADLCFVFGTRHGVPEFCNEIARLWYGDYFPHIHVTGGMTPGDSRTEADVIREGLVERGIPRQRISMEERATNTGENVRYSLPVLDREIGLGNISSLIAVGKLCTSRRYLMTLQRHWPEVRKMLLPVHYHAVPRDRWMEHDELRERIVGEWRRIGPYFERDFIAEVDLTGVEYRPRDAL